MYFRFQCSEKKMKLRSRLLKKKSLEIGDGIISEFQGTRNFISYINILMKCI
jgi:hypothetical protein